MSDVQTCGQDHDGEPLPMPEPQDSVVTTETDSETTTTTHSKTTTTTTHGGGDGDGGDDGGEPGPAEPTAEATADEVDPYTAVLTYSGFPEGKVLVSWGDGGEDEEADGPEGEVRHTYAEDVEGPELTIAVTAADDETVTAQATFTLEESGS